MASTSIDWTDKTWNPVTGCDKISTGCANCYAETMARRLKGMGQKKYINGFEVTLHPDDLQEPMLWKKHCNIFVCSMGDLFHDKVPFDFVDKVMNTIYKTPQHIYQILTKRPLRMKEYFYDRIIPDNVWLGTTVECKASLSRIEQIRYLSAKVKFLSCEPLLENLGNLNLEGINWIIVGGESGVRARPMNEEWAINIMRQADKSGIPFFFKQWGTWGADGIKRNKHANGKLLQGIIHHNYPK